MSIFGEFSYYYTIGVCDVLTMGLDSTLSSGNFFLYSCCILARYVFKTPEWPGYSAESTLTVLMTSERTWISGGIFSVQYLLCYTVNWTSLKPFQKCVHHYSISMRLGLHFSNFFDQLWICTGGPKDMNFKLLRAECRQKFTSWDWITFRPCWEEISFLPIFLFFREKRSEMWREAAVWLCDKCCLSHSIDRKSVV